MQDYTSTKRNNTWPIFCGTFLHLWKGGARLHDALHATGPDLVCNITVRTQNVVAPPRSPPRAPPALDSVHMITTKRHGGIRSSTS